MTTRSLARRLFTAMALALCALLPTGAHAGIPGWANATRTTSHPAHDCMKSASAAVKAVTGKDPTVESDGNKVSSPARIRGFTADAGIFVYCYSNQKSFCQTGKGADYSVLVFSDKGSGDAAKVRDAFLNAFKESKSVCID